jgi:lipopolysaccharide heptosyltransferase II
VTEPVAAAEHRGTRNPEPGTLVVQTAYLGDVVLTLPLMQRLAAKFGPVDVVATPAAMPLLAAQPGVRRAIAYDKRGTDRGWAGLSRLAGVLRQRHYPRAYLPHRSLRSALLARLAGIPERIGFSGGLAAFWHTARVERPTDGHETARLASLAGTGAPIAAPWFTLTGEDRQAAAAWLAARGLQGDFMVLAPGARWATKRWPYFPALASNLPLPVVAIGSAEDRPMGGAIEAAAPGRAHSAAGAVALTVSAALIERSTLVVSNDSVALHLAGALARPVVALAGPTGPAPGFGPFSAADSVLGHSDLPCRPCSVHGHARCPLGHHRCMTELSAEQVTAAVLARLERIRGNPGPEERRLGDAAAQ